MVVIWLKIKTAQFTFEQTGIIWSLQQPYEIVQVSI